MMVVLFAGYTAICTSLHSHIYENTVELSAYRNSDIIKYSLYRLMLKNENAELFQTIQMIGNEPGVENIRIFNKKGEIKYSIKSSEIGQIVDMKAEACYACHTADKPIQSLSRPEKTRIYRGSQGQRIMAMINPIRNSPECSNHFCHAHQAEQTILGVLDVQMSLKELDEAVRENRIIVFSSFFGFLFLAMILFSIFLYWFIYKPVRILQEGTMRLALGNLDYRINMKREDELGILARSFNNMAENLRVAYAELKEWSNKLADRVKEKTNELEQMHRGMLQVEKMTSLGKMAASVAHELNNPIAGIVTYSKLLAKRMSKIDLESNSKEKILKDLELIRSESLRCGNIVKNLLSFARGTSANIVETNLSQIIEKGLSIIQHHLQLGQIETEVEIDLQNDQVNCDPDQMLQAFIALFINAVEAMPNGGKLSIRVQKYIKDADQILIQVKDTGTGISKEVLDKIFEPFFTTKKDKSGVGLGLPVVYGIIERHHGKIWIESEVNQGTTFFILIPGNQFHTKNNDIEAKENETL